MAQPRKGDRWRYVGGAPLGELLHGTEVTVRDIVDAGETGAHDDSEDAVVVEWRVVANVIVGHDDDGNPVHGTGENRPAMSVGVAAFPDAFEFVAAAPAEDGEVDGDAG